MYLKSNLFFVLCKKSFHQKSTLKGRNHYNSLLLIQWKIQWHRKKSMFLFQSIIEFQRKVYFIKVVYSALLMWNTIQEVLHKSLTKILYIDFLATLTKTKWLRSIALKIVFNVIQFHINKIGSISCYEWCISDSFTLFLLLVKIKFTN